MQRCAQMSDFVALAILFNSVDSSLFLLFRVDDGLLLPLPFFLRAQRGAVFSLLRNCSLLHRFSIFPEL